MRLDDFLPLIEKTETHDQLTCVVACASVCCEFTEEEWPRLSAAINTQTVKVTEGS